MCSCTRALVLPCACVCTRSCARHECAHLYRLSVCVRARVCFRVPITFVPFVRPIFPHLSTSFPRAGMCVCSAVHLHVRAYARGAWCVPSFHVRPCVRDVFARAPITVCVLQTHSTRLCLCSCAWCWTIGPSCACAPPLAPPAGKQTTTTIMHATSDEWH